MYYIKSVLLSLVLVQFGVIKTNSQGFQDYSNYHDDACSTIVEYHPRIHEIYTSNNSFLTELIQDYYMGYSKLIHRFQQVLNVTFTRPFQEFAIRQKSKYDSYAATNRQRIDSICNRDFLKVFEEFLKQYVKIIDASSYKTFQYYKDLYSSYNSSGVRQMTVVPEGLDEGRFKFSDLKPFVLSFDEYNCHVLYLRFLIDQIESINSGLMSALRPLFDLSNRYYHIYDDLLQCYSYDIE